MDARYPTLSGITAPCIKQQNKWLADYKNLRLTAPQKKVLLNYRYSGMYKLLDKQENRIKQQHFVCIF